MDVVQVVSVMNAIIVHGKCHGSCGGELAVALHHTGWLWLLLLSWCWSWLSYYAVPYTWQATAVSSHRNVMIHHTSRRAAKFMLHTIDDMYYMYSNGCPVVCIICSELWLCEMM